MSRYETYRVCKYCFNLTKTSNPPVLEESRHLGTCISCGGEWVGINIGYYNPDKKYYEVRRRQYYSENKLCSLNIKDKCDRGEKCRYAHNRLELELWIEEEEEKLLTEMKKVITNKISCVICRVEFRDVPNLEIHLESRDHVARTNGMKILPEVGSSLQYKGPIRARPKVPFSKDTYELCLSFMKHGRCDFLTGCKHAHSEEELIVWLRAKMAEDKTLERSEKKSSRSKPPIPSSDPCGKATDGSTRFKYQRQDIPKQIEGDLEYYWRVQGEIQFLRIEDVIKNRPNHIEILCNNNLEQTMDESLKEFKWVFRIKSSEREILHGIILYNDRNMFKLEGVHKGVKGGKYCEIKFPYIPNRNCYQLQQEIDSTTFIDVTLVFKPKIGQHQVYIVVECKDGGLVARKVNVKVKGVTFKEANKTFKDETKPPPKKKVPPVEDTLPINWEQDYRLINTKYFQNKHRMPDNMEERVKTGFYDKINDMIVKGNYFARFQTLLHLEEFEHRKSLSKYDLLNYEITYKIVEKEILIENDCGDERVETAEVNRRFIRFNLNHQLFEGYRAFRPPKIAYIIPNHTKTAYECYCVRTAIDYLIFSITIDTIEACEESGGLAMVRFTPERDEYEKMHQALDDIKPLRDTILFPTLREVRTPEQWDKDHLLSLLDNETLTITQKNAVYSIINSKYTSIPTIICGPFGCGKTKTLAIAAKLIGLTFHNSRILIATKTNSCANLYINLLAEFFGGIEMLYNKRRPKLYRHFATTRNILCDQKIHKFTNIQDGAYIRLPLNELERYSIVVTTSVASSSLIHPKDRDCTKNLFTHIFIDHAAQLIEPEACIPLSLAGLDTKIALAGDVRQSRPLILSKHGRQFNLDQSLLERLDTLPEYQHESPYKCNITLLENFRSSVEIVCFLSELFYEGNLRYNPPTLEGPADFPSLSFLHVKGEERRLYGFPSFYNEEEAELTVGVLQKFANLGVRVERMAVLTTYKSQVRLIYDYLRKEETKCRDLGHFKSKDQSCRVKNCVNKRTIDVKNLESIDGMEYDLIVVNTVRSTSNLPKDISLEERLDLGLLDDVKQFNTILTRARGWVVVIGDSDCVTNIGDCSNVWSKYVNACKGHKGFYKSLMDLEEFGNEVTKHTEKNERNRSKGLPDANEAGLFGSIENVNPPDVHTQNTCQTKSNSLNEFIKICQQEISQVHANNDIAEALHDQLTFTRIALENLKKQTFEVKKCEERERSLVKKTNPTETSKKRNSINPFEDVVPLQNQTEETYQNKSNSLHRFVTICQQEITQVHDNTEIAAAINDQLTFVKISLGNLERQRYLEQQKTL